MTDVVQRCIDAFRFGTFGRTPDGLCLIQAPFVLPIDRGAVKQAVVLVLQAWHANVLGNVSKGDVVAIWGAGKFLLKSSISYLTSMLVCKLRDVI